MAGGDHRTRVTKMLIRRAFTELLRVKPVQSISIKELCEKAGVNRGTFYAHYASVHDLLMQMEDEMLSEILEDFQIYPEQQRICLKGGYEHMGISMSEKARRQISLFDEE